MSHSLNKKHTVYVSGPMSGIENLNYPLFYHIDKRLVAGGYRVLNPADNRVENKTGDELYQEFMRLALKQLLESDSMVLLPGWQNSKGAVMEKTVADMIGINTFELTEIEAAMDTPLVLPWHTADSWNDGEEYDGI